uniref:Uncharacterized protein n=1 Tax=Kalanchoe fedtschenkoi TaxID=63787 RepID=A0A7N0V9V9_KALFE
MSQSNTLMDTSARNKSCLFQAKQSRRKNLSLAFNNIDFDAAKTFMVWVKLACLNLHVQQQRLRVLLLQLCLKLCQGGLMGPLPMASLENHLGSSSRDVLRALPTTQPEGSSGIDGSLLGPSPKDVLNLQLGASNASVAAGNHGVPVVIAGHSFGNASGMAPRSHIAVYKALYKGFGGFAADVVAAIDQAAQDGVDIINLSITPNRRPPGIATFFNPIDMALLSAVKAGIFVIQAAGNTGPSFGSMSSFSPWIYTVGAASHSRVYENSIILGNGVTLPGVGFSSGTGKDIMYTLVYSQHVLNNDTTITKDMYVSECQDSSVFDPGLVRGNLLICRYSVRFVLGLATVNQAIETASNLTAAGIVFYMDPFLTGYQINPVPMKLPGILISSANNSKILFQYYNSSIVKDESEQRVARFGACGSIMGGFEANLNRTAPKIMYYSARGPDPEDSIASAADILKPNLVAPGDSIWGAWSSLGTDSVEFRGESFAMMSGTSMAAPHIAGIAALVKQKFPKFSTSAIASALSTTASLYDNSGRPIMAERSNLNPDQNQVPSTPFDMGHGFVNATAALDPGLIFETSCDLYMSFICGINGSAPVVLNYTGEDCVSYKSTISAVDLNLPSITIAKLNQSRTVQRAVTNIAGNESYVVGWSPPYGVSIKVTPTRFSIGYDNWIRFVAFVKKMRVGREGNKCSEEVEREAEHYVHITRPLVEEAAVAMMH